MILKERQNSRHEEQLDKENTNCHPQDAIAVVVQNQLHLRVRCLNSFIEPFVLWNLCTVKCERHSQLVRSSPPTKQTRQLRTTLQSFPAYREAITQTLDASRMPPSSAARSSATTLRPQNTFSPCVVHDGVEPVSDGEHCTVSELTPNRLLNEFISFQIHRGRGFIKNQDLTFTEQRTR